MSIEDLQRDLKLVGETIVSLSADPLIPTEDKIRRVAEELLAMLASTVEEVSDIDDAVTTVIEQSDDILQEETAAVILAPMLLADALVNELRTRASTDNRILTAIKEYKRARQAADECIQEITVASDDDGDDGDDEVSDAEDGEPENPKETEQ